MSNLSDFLGGGGAPIGSIVATPGVINDPKWLALDGQVRNKADYPDLDTSKMLTFDGSSLVAGPTLAAVPWKVIHITGTTWYAHRTDLNATGCARSTDNGASWTTGTLPGPPSGSTDSWTVSYANGLFFLTKNFGSGTNIYHTSTDGLSWTSRSTLPILGGTYPFYGGVVYTAGRFVMLPSSASAAANGLWALHSTDGITWTAVLLGANSSGGSVNASSALYGVSSFGRVDISPLLGIQISVSNVQSMAQATSLDGVNWFNVGKVNSSGNVDTSITVGLYGLTATNGYSSVASMVAIGNHPRGNRRTNAGFGGFPMRGSNITVGAGFSEDHGVTRHSSPLAWLSANTDFSGSRLLHINSSGNVFWIDVNATKFRAIPPLQEAELPLMGQTLYMKVR